MCRYPSGATSCVVTQAELDARTDPDKMNGASLSDDRASSVRSFRGRARCPPEPGDTPAPRAGVLGEAARRGGESRERASGCLANIERLSLSRGFEHRSRCYPPRYPRLFRTGYLRSKMLKSWWVQQDSNLRPAD